MHRGDAFFHEEMEVLRRDLDVAEKDELRDLEQAGAADLFAELGDGEGFLGLADLGPLLLDVKAKVAVACGVEAADVGASFGIWFGSFF